MAKKNDVDTSIDGTGNADITDKVLLVRMVRTGNVEPLEADVHPDEVSNYQRGGWQVESPITDAE